MTAVQLISLATYWELPSTKIIISVSIYIQESVPVKKMTYIDLAFIQDTITNVIDFLHNLENGAEMLDSKQNS